MPHESRPKLQVLMAGKRRYISVPSRHAGDLLAFLRSHGVRSAPPEPDSTGFDSIELPRDTDTAAVQQLLDGWA